MKLVRYGERGAEKPGLIDAAGQLRDLSAHVPDIAGTVLADLSALQRIDPQSLPLVPGAPRLGAAVGNIGKFICIGLNYSDHAAESGMAVPPEPIIFAKYTSAVLQGPHDRRERERDRQVAAYAGDLRRVPLSFLFFCFCSFSFQSQEADCRLRANVGRFVRNTKSLDEDLLYADNQAGKEIERSKNCKSCGLIKM